MLHRVMKSKNILSIVGGLAFGFSPFQAQGAFVLFGEEGKAPEPSEKFVRPISAPYLHEDSFVTTDVRAWYAKHHFNSDTIGGEADLGAAQFRLALTKSLQFVAYKDGYLSFDDTLGDESGFTDVGAGIKWAFYQDWENRFHLAVGAGYEFPVGSDDILQDTATLRLWGSWNKGFGRLHLGGTVNYLNANNTGENTFGNADSISAHLHADYYLTSWLSPVVEVNGYFVTDEGPGRAPFSGVDVVSVAGGEGEPAITGAFGFELRPFERPVAFRGAYETELTDNRTLFGHRWTVSAVYEF